MGYTSGTPCRCGRPRRCALGSRRRVEPRRWRADTYTSKPVEAAPPDRPAQCRRTPGWGPRRPVAGLCRPEGAYTPAAEAGSWGKGGAGERSFAAAEHSTAAAGTAAGERKPWAAALGPSRLGVAAAHAWPKADGRDHRGRAREDLLPALGDRP